MKTIFEKSQARQHAFSLPKENEAFKKFFPDPAFLRKEGLDLPEVSEIDLTRHFSQLARRNMGIDDSFYPLGSCSMKLNPRINEVCAQLPGFANSHPFAPDEMVQGNLQLIHELVELLCEVAGMSAGSLNSNAGAQGEFVGIRMIAEYHKKRKDFKRDEILVPDNAHGTNPASAALAGFKTVSIRSNAQGDMDIEHLKSLVSERTAGLMLTNPNTLGLFTENILEVAKIIHSNGGLLYYDGANLNAILGMARPGDMGFDVMHMNLHKTFSTPHGGGGPGSGPVFCNDKLKEFLPVPRVEKDVSGKYVTIWKDDGSIGNISTFYGNFAIYLRAYLYAKLHGFYGMRRIAEVAVLNANYLKERLSGYFTVPYNRYCMHEFVLQADNYLDQGVRALDIAKRMLDYDVHAPTVYFPLIVKECMLVEPTESESKDTLDKFVEIVGAIVKEIEEDPERVRGAPYSKPVRRLDEVLAAKKPVLKHVIKS